MKIISARDFRENQSKYLGFVDKGESVILQVRGGCYKIMLREKALHNDSP